MWLKMMWKDKESGKKKKNPGRYSETQRQVFSQNAGRMLVTWKPGWAWWQTPIRLGRRRWEEQEFKVSLSYTVSLKSAHGTGGLVFKKKKCENVFKRYHWEVGHIRAAAERAESYSWNLGTMMSEWDPAAEHNCDLFIQLGGWGMDLEAQSSFSRPLSLSPSRLPSLLPP